MSGRGRGVMRMMRVLSAVGACAAAMCSACRSTSGQQGSDRGVTAAYSFGALTCDLGPEVTVEQSASAAAEAFGLRGYTVTSRSVTSDRARVEAKSPGDGFLEKAVVETWLTAGGIRTRVKVEPWGDESASRAILDEMLVLLGR